MTATSIEAATSDLVSLNLVGDGHAVRLVAVGEIDSSSAPLLRRELDAVLERAVQEIVVDLDGVTFLDSAGLCALASVHRRAAAKGVQLRVLASARAVMRPLQITGLWNLLGAEQVAPGEGSAA